MRQFGMEGQIRGCLFDSEMRTHRVTLDSNDFASLAIEGERALRIASNGALDAAFPVIELHHFVFRGPSKTLPELVGNNGLNGGFVLPHDGWPSSRDYVTGRGALSVRINSRLIASGELWPMRGGAEASVAWLRSHLADAGLVLSPGQIVLAGTPPGLYPVELGDHVAVFVDDEIGAECTIV